MLVEYLPSPLAMQTKRLATACCLPGMEHRDQCRKAGHPCEAADLHQLPRGSSNLELSLPAPGTCWSYKLPTFLLKALNFPQFG